jgi:hypothetical protein
MAAENRIESNQRQIFTFSSLALKLNIERQPEALIDGVFLPMLLPMLFLLMEPTIIVGFGNNLLTKRNRFKRCHVSHSSQC